MKSTWAEVKSRINAISENLADSKNAIRENDIESLIDSVNDLVCHAIELQREINF